MRSTRRFKFVAHLFFPFIFTKRDSYIQKQKTSVGSLAPPKALHYDNFMNHRQRQFSDQHFSNGYELVNGVTMHAENPENFQIPPDVIKRNVGSNQFIELRIDSPRFSVHEDAAEKCTCPSCNGELSKPILRHNQPASLLPLPRQSVPSRGWGEDFWVRITERSGGFLRGVVDNPLVEARLHGLNQGDEIIFHQDHILAVHEIHRLELVAGMDELDLKELAQWLSRMNHE